jgi:hypothetical protein
VEGQTKTKKKTPIFIDGEKYEATSDSMSVEELLALVGKTPAEWYIVEKHGREQTEYHDPAEVPIKSGAKFLTVYTGATPVS